MLVTGGVPGGEVTRIRRIRFGSEDGGLLLFELFNPRLMETADKTSISEEITTLASSGQVLFSCKTFLVAAIVLETRIFRDAIFPSRKIVP